MACQLKRRRLHSPAGLAMRHVQIPVEMEVEHSQLGHRPLSQRNVRLSSAWTTARSSSSGSGTAYACGSSTTSGRSPASCLLSSGYRSAVCSLGIRIHHHCAAGRRSGKQTARAPAASGHAPSMMVTRAVVLVVFLQSVKAARGTRRVFFFFEKRF